MFILYFTSGCHLCDLAEQQIAQFNAAHANLLAYQKVEIAESDALVKQYGTRIPVLKHPEDERTLDWPFAQPDLEELLKSVKS